MSRIAFVRSAILILTGVVACAQGDAWHDPSPHHISFIEVANHVSVEVLDWGGSGTAVVLLAGSGNTAHVFDEFAPKLIDCCHVYGITRRGFGASSRPDSGYDDQTLADDVVAVLNAAHLAKPVLVGHSMAGGELTTIGRQRSNLVSGLVFLDAVFDPGDTAADPAFVALQQKQPRGIHQPPPLDLSSFDAYHDSQSRAKLGAFPISELRQLFATRQDGGIGRYQASTSAINAAIGAGQIKRDYSNIQMPVLALIDFPVLPGDPLRTGYIPSNDEERATMTDYTGFERRYVEARVAALERGVPAARVIPLAGAGHFVFLTREAEVLSEIHRFVAALSQ